MMRILVTGGAGFIGSNLCFYLLQQGHQVYCLDCHFPSHKPHLAHLASHANFHVIEHNVIDPFRIDVDQIYHLACPASPKHYQQDPIHTFQTAVWGTKNMLDLVKELNIPLLHASTSEIYGDPLQHPQNEMYWGNVNPLGIRSCYNEGKRGAESLCMDYFRVYRIPIRIVRIFNTYGPYMDIEDGRVIPNFIKKALFNQPLEIYGNGQQTRSFQYIDDLIRGLHLMINHSQDEIEPVNLGNPIEFTINDLAQFIIQLTQSKSVIHYLPPLADDPYRRRPDITRAQHQLHWDPVVSLQTGLSHTINYFRQLLHPATQVNRYNV